MGLETLRSRALPRPAGGGRSYSNKSEHSKQPRNAHGVESCKHPAMRQRTARKNYPAPADTTCKYRMSQEPNVRLRTSAVVASVALAVAISGVADAAAERWGPSYAADAEVLSDGGQIAFERSEAIYLVNADGSGLQRLTPRGWRADAAVWSPDGRRIVSFGATRTPGMPRMLGTSSTLCGQTAPTSRGSLGIRFPTTPRLGHRAGG